MSEVRAVRGMTPLTSWCKARVWISGRSWLCLACPMLALLPWVGCSVSASVKMGELLHACWMTTTCPRVSWHRGHTVNVNGNIPSRLQGKTCCGWLEELQYYSLLQRGRLVNISAVFWSQKYLLFLLLATAVFFRGKNSAITSAGAPVQMLYRASLH